MLSQMNIKGIKTLSKEELKNVNGGETITCYVDGGYWQDTSSDFTTIFSMINYCISSGGTFAISDKR